MKPILHYLNKVIEGDCLLVMADFPDQHIDFMLCDLPFDRIFRKRYKPTGQDFGPDG